MGVFPWSQLYNNAVKAAFRHRYSDRKVSYVAWASGFLNSGARAGRSSQLTRVLRHHRTSRDQFDARTNRFTLHRLIKLKTIAAQDPWKRSKKTLQIDWWTAVISVKPAVGASRRAIIKSDTV